MTDPKVYVPAPAPSIPGGDTRFFYEELKKLEISLGLLVKAVRELQAAP